MENQQVAYDMFKKLAYKKFKNVPLYLEWAPINVLDKEITGVLEINKQAPKAKKLKKLEYAVDEPEQDESNEQTMQTRSEDGAQAEGRSEEKSEANSNADETNKEDERKSYKILVKNVPFEATVKEVRELFGAFGDLQYVRLPKKLHGTGSHRGFAFVEYVNRNDAKKAFSALSQSTHLYGRRLVLAYSLDRTDANSDDL